MNENNKGLYSPQFEHDSCGVGFVVNIKGRKSNEIVKQGLEILKRLAHRGAVGADPKTGDGAGILLQIPHEFLTEVCDKIKLPPPGAYGTGIIFFPQDLSEKEKYKKAIKKYIELEGQIFLGFRPVPVDDSDIGKSAKETQPSIEQVFIQKGQKVNTQLEFERKLYLIRKQVEISGLTLTHLSSRTIIYKGLLMPHQVEKYFLDLQNPKFKSAVALVHSRYSTNTFPSWNLSQPFRFLAHNGEINTLRGNINWMKAREGILHSKVFDIAKLKPIIVPEGSDSASLDNMLELLVLSGRTISQAMMMLVPQAWERNRQIPKSIKDFYQFNSCFMEPWDGPAAIAFTDGEKIGAMLDRNGLRPARYIITKSGNAVMASEAGVLDIEPSEIIVSGRIEPGKMLFIDFEEGRIIADEEIKDTAASAKPYGEWLKKNILELSKLPKISSSQKEIPPRLFNAFGYTREDFKFIIKPMAEKGKEPIGSMGNDTPHAFLSKKPQLLFSYFKQLFAQVTNPPIDPIREEIVMSLECLIGPQKNMLDETPEHCRKLLIKEPILLDEEVEKIRGLNKKGFKTKTINTFFNSKKDNGFIDALNDICHEAEKAINDGYTFIVLSDRGNEKNSLPILMACGAVHHYLVNKSLRTQVGIIIESAEPREVHHFALLFGYGADCINPYLAYEAISLLEKEINIDHKTAIGNYRRAINHGILKILSKIGISTLSSYKGAQVFEALGLADEVIDKCFAGTVSRVGGLDFKAIADETIIRQEITSDVLLPAGGIYQWKRDGEFHLLNPDSISALQDSVRKEDFTKYKEFSRMINDQKDNPTTLRGLLKFKKASPIPIDQVEPIESIMKRFVTGAMSFGSISREAHETLAIAMNKIGGKSNTGEGGEDPARFKDDRRSAVKQVASGRFGVTTNYLVNADELQIKIAQGAKPGEGGQLPGYKVSAIIARTRYVTPGVTLISPPPHHDIYSIEDLAQLIFDLKNVNPTARISVKLVSEAGVGTVAAGVAKGHADMILISGGDGGTGAAPQTSIRYAGLPWELGLSETHQTLILNDLRGRVRLQTDGQMRTGRDVAIAALLGAEEFGFCTSVLIVCGCVMLRHCHLNNCSVGVATQDEFLGKRFSGRPEYVITYFKFIAQELREIMAGLGIKTVDEMIGRSDLLEQDNISTKAKTIDYSKILWKPEVSHPIRFSKLQKHELENVLDRKLIEGCAEALNNKKPVRLQYGIKNNNRAVGAMLSGEICRRFGEAALPENTINVKFNGVAGQSFGAWLVKGVVFELEGMANDYIGKGISGGKIIIYPDKKAGYDPSKNVIIGNTSFYGAIEGEAYIRGIAGERFCIRNSGLYAVIEGVGDHGLEYMTGGRVIVIGSTGRNFAAGMSGGIAYVYDKNADFSEKCNLQMVELESLKKDDEKIIQELLHNHFKYTGSTVAKKIIDNFMKEKRKFVKVMPIEYKRVLQEKVLEEKELELMEISDG
ncbi:MAG: glutamate synthase (NADH) large subunit [Candidatus Saganbacteria bacterium]|uniref:Glutamate synthase (NADH) large subunit n=1 Tax=Candidatus Saganbacteria bacterium TaxID=2575572 RepID=A0A833L282_UNCSA|nr:MAG: glutamate synthase (NADH) large subunit [Candidatus Saganbacteria bacterium]